jgi:hypothetical protein
LAIILSLLDSVQQVVVSSVFATVLAGLYWLWRSRARKIFESETGSTDV